VFHLLEHPEFYVGSSAIHGLGLHSRVAFGRNDTLFRLAGRYFHEAYDENYEIGSNWFSVGLNCWLIPYPRNPGRFVNHSCEANTQLCDDFSMRALRPITAGAEILIDYSTTELDPHWWMACNCSALACRRIVKPFYQVSGPPRQRVLSTTPRTLRYLHNQMNACRSQTG
jgi:uncharacterized protein